MNTLTKDKKIDILSKAILDMELLISITTGVTGFTFQAGSSSWLEQKESGFMKNFDEAARIAYSQAGLLYDKRKGMK